MDSRNNLAEDSDISTLNTSTAFLNQNSHINRNSAGGLTNFITITSLENGVNFPTNILPLASMDLIHQQRQNPIGTISNQQSHMFPSQNSSNFDTTAYLTTVIPSRTRTNASYHNPYALLPNIRTNSLSNNPIHFSGSTMHPIPDNVPINSSLSHTPINYLSTLSNPPIAVINHRRPNHTTQNSNTLQVPRPLKRFEHAGTNRWPTVQHQDGSSTSMVHTPPPKIRRISISDEDARNYLSSVERNPLINNAQQIFQPQQPQSVIPITAAIPIATTLPPPSSISVPSTLMTSNTTGITPVGVEYFVASALNTLNAATATASAINAATASIPSIVAAAAAYSSGPQTCPVCIASVCHHSTPSTVSTCGSTCTNCIYNQQLRGRVCHQQHLPPLVCSYNGSGSNVNSSSLSQQLYNNATIVPPIVTSNRAGISSGIQMGNDANPNPIHSEILANRILQQERSQSSINQFYQQQRQQTLSNILEQQRINNAVNIMQQHLAAYHTPSNIHQHTPPTIIDPAMMFILPVPEATALVLNGPSLTQTHQVHATIFAAATAAAAAAGISSEPQPVGICPSEIEKFSNILHYVKKQDVSEDEIERCTICQIDLETGDLLRVLNCAHLFHTECIDKWVVYNKKCPVCRVDMDKINDLNSVATEETASSLVN